MTVQSCYQTLYLNELTADVIEACIMAPADVIVVKDFYDRALCEEIAGRMIGSRLHGQYTNAPDIGRVGKALFESQASHEDRDQYDSGAGAWIRELRTACAPFLTPIDKIRLELDEAWLGGASLGSLHGKRLFVGLARIFGEGSGAEPHQDVLAWDMPTEIEAHTLAGQMALNVYLKVPPRGGELLIWPISLSQKQYEELRIPGSYGVDPTSLGIEPIVIRPEQGDLICFNSRRLHAVEPSWGDHRVTWSAFAGVKARHEPLMLWS